jgi:SAM-dependent methyltransferase
VGADLADILAVTASYYSRKAFIHGATPAGVDWPCAASQELRIAQLLGGFGFEKPCSLNDLGCGYGAALATIAKLHPRAEIDYLGVDLSSEMVRLAQQTWSAHPRATFTVASESPRIADYSIASGIFNVKLGCSTKRWEELVRKTLRELGATSRRGFAVNFLVAENEHEIAELYRTEPEAWGRYCEQECDARVDVVSGYGLPECTLIARKASHV